MREIQNGPENDRRSVIPRERLSRRVAIGLAALIAIVVALASCSTETVTDVAPGTDASAPTDDDGSIDPFGPEGGAADSSAGSHHDASDGAQPTGTCGSSCNGCCNGNTCVAACPTGLVCDTHNHVCVPPPCSATNPCAAGCCAGGVCQTGTAVSACGASGSCNDCSANAAGHACVAGGACGCNVPTDCPTSMACDSTTHTCKAACSDTALCNGACCVDGACTNAFNACAGNPKGDVCVSTISSCGCNTSSQCPTGTACNTKTHLCSSACSATDTCNGGCCNAGTCAPGNTDLVCGATPVGFVSKACRSCPASPTGGHCTGGSCGGCTTASDCSAGGACAGGRCCLPKGGIPDPGNPQQCCSDLIVGVACF